MAEDTPWDAGVDVAEGGDNETVLVVRQGARIVLKRAWAKADPRGEVAAALYGQYRILAAGAGGQGGSQEPTLPSICKIWAIRVGGIMNVGQAPAG